MENVDTLMVKLANQCGFDLKFELVALVIGKCFVVLQTGPKRNQASSSNQYEQTCIIHVNQGHRYKVDEGVDRAY